MPNFSYLDTLQIPIRFFSVIKHVHFFEPLQILMHLLFIVFAALNGYLTTLFVAAISWIITDMENKAYGNAWTNIGYCAAITIAKSVCDIILNTLQMGYAYLWRKHLTHQLLKLYFGDQVYYTMLNFSNQSIDNPYVF